MERSGFVLGQKVELILLTCVICFKIFILREFLNFNLFSLAQYSQEWNADKYKIVYIFILAS